jgi:4-amino-4-deoxy-L-arabinose transferase-like glycosyltransferase
MEEPSVLDYLKSKLNPWSRGKIDLPEVILPEATQLPPALPAFSASLSANLGRLPWRSLLALALALTGQSLLEPPNPQHTLAVAFYLAALIFFAWAVWQAEWVLPELRQEFPSLDSGVFKRKSLIAALAFGVLALWSLGDNLFTPFNVSLWFFSIGLLVSALWVQKTSWAQRWDQVRNFLSQNFWQVKITPWLILLFLVFGLAAFYRFSNLAGIPAEPFSDHAEKLLDVYDITQGHTFIFFPRNTGREFFQMYLTVAVAAIFNTGLSFLSLKLGTALAGFFTLPYVYLLGKELFNKRVAFFALVFTAVAYWPNVISRVGLRFPLYPLFVAPVLFYLLRGLRRQDRNDFILSGLFLGLGLHGYSPFRFTPIVVVIVVLLYLLHPRSAELRKQTLTLSAILVLTSFFVFLPLLRYGLEYPDVVAFRSLTRLAELERPLPGEPLPIFFDNLKNAMLVFNLNNGNTWTNSVMNRPALDLVSAAFFVFGTLVLFVRYLRQRDWRDLFLVLSVPLLMMPSILSLAFPQENPSLNRAGGAYITVFIIVAFALDGLLQGLQRLGWRKSALALITFLLAWSAMLNYDLLFRQYASQFRYSAWNISDIGRVTQSFVLSGNPAKNAWVIAYPYWVDTRLVGTWLGDPLYNPVLWPESIPDTLAVTGNKLFFIKDNDIESLNLLRQTYPQGSLSYFKANAELTGKDFWVFSVPSSEITLP